MSINQCMALMFLVLCVSRTSCAINESTAEDYKSDASHEYEDYDASTEISTPISVSTVELTFAKTDAPITLSSVQPPTKAKNLSCPKNCKCSDIIQHVNCSFQMLKSIPDNLPLNLLQLDLSHNELEVLNATQLNKYTEIRELIIRNNSITKIINAEDFIKLEKLQTIDLIANKLQPLNGAEFTKATNLAHLTLSNNSGIVDSNVIFAEMAKSLITLNIANCNIMQLSDNIFENLPSLIALDLRDNPLESNLNSEAFKYLLKLRTLRISSIAEKNVLNVCKALESIDLINMDKYDVSCFELSAGSTLDESTIKSGQNIFITSDIDNLYKTYTNAPPPITPMKTIPTKNVSQTTTPIIDETNIQTSKQQMSSISQNEKPNLKANDNLNKTVTTHEIESSQNNVSNETIYLLLTGLIVLTLVSLMIGIICRLDCCGIKTKCCRTNHNNRATSQDHGQSHEEIPLNKV